MKQTSTHPFTRLSRVLLFFFSPLFLFSFLLFSFLPATFAQTVSNVKLDYSCPCKVTATYNVSTNGDVALYYSLDPGPDNWLLAETFWATTGPNTGTWDCDAAGVLYGQFYFKLEPAVSCSDPVTITMPMVFVEGGTFTLGAATQPSTDGVGANYDGRAISNAHNVTLSSFCIGQTTVTQAQFAAVMDTNPSQFPDDPNKPVEQVTWYGAITFCNKLSLLEGKMPVYSLSPDIDWANFKYIDIPKISDATWDAVTMNIFANGYRLPTEAEWEYAARGGQKSLTAQGNPPDYFYAGSNTADEVAWYWDNGEDRTWPVGQRLPNALGLYDMSGNVIEWCWDLYDNYTATAKTNPTGPTTSSFTPIGRLQRGGSAFDNAYYLSVSCRGAFMPHTGWMNGGLGFRVVCRNTWNNTAVLINGVLWATRNVDAPGTFANNPEDAGMLYQWGIPVGWSNADPMINSNGGNTWNSFSPGDTIWTPANDPSPTGYRVPTDAEIQSLLSPLVDREEATLNGVPGMRFTDKSNGNSMFMPYPGWRDDHDLGDLYTVGEMGFYWSSWQTGDWNAHCLRIRDFFLDIYNPWKGDGMSIRPVVE